MNRFQNDNRRIDNQLTVFTDQIFEGSTDTDQKTLAPDPELRALEQTVLQLKNTFNEGGPSEAIVKRMRQNIVKRWKQQETRAEESAWKKILSVLKPPGQKWQTQGSRQRWVVAISLLAIAVLVFISAPLLDKVGSSQPAASGLNLNFSVVIAFGGLILLAIWFFRRKS